MSILRSFLLIPSSTHDLSSLTSISGRTQTHFPASNLHLPTSTLRFDTMKIRMGGGPRTYPGGVSKWQWKRMQANKSKQLLKARLARERQIYEMRKRAELKAAVSELERPWEVVEKAPKLFSVGADEQLKALADRFQKPGGFDMWSERDGPELFKPGGDGVSSARYFPKGVVHSGKPCRKIENSVGFSEESNSRVDEENRGDNGDGGHVVSLSDILRDGLPPKRNLGVTPNRSRQKNSVKSHEFGYREIRDSKEEKRTVFADTINRGRQVDSRNSVEGSRDSKEEEHQMRYSKEAGYRNGGDSRMGRNHQARYPGSNTGGDARYRSGYERRVRNRSKMSKDLDVFDMNVQQDGSYGIQAKD